MAWARLSLTYGRTEWLKARGEIIAARLDICKPSTLDLLGLVHCPI